MRRGKGSRADCAMESTPAAQGDEGRASQGRNEPLSRDRPRLAHSLESGKTN
jgi:hypothetical protein